MVGWWALVPDVKWEDKSSDPTWGAEDDTHDDFAEQPQAKKRKKSKGSPADTDALEGRKKKQKKKRPSEHFDG